MWTNWVGVKMTKRRNDKVRHFGTATKWHGILLISFNFYLLVKKTMITKQQNITLKVWYWMVLKTRY